MKAKALTCTNWWDGPTVGTLRLEDGRELCYWWSGVCAADEYHKARLFELWSRGYEDREAYPEGETPLGTIREDEIDWSDMIGPWETA